MGWQEDGTALEGLVLSKHSLKCFLLQANKNVLFKVSISALSRGFSLLWP